MSESETHLGDGPGAEDAAGAEVEAAAVHPEGLVELVGLSPPEALEPHVHGQTERTRPLREDHGPRAVLFPAIPAAQGEALARDVGVAESDALVDGVHAGRDEEVGEAVGKA